MSKDEATVERVARTFMSKLLPKTTWEKLTDFERSVAQSAARECITALPSESGMVAALEDLIHQVEGLKQEDAESFDLDQARQALAQHRAGNPWSDTPPTEPGWWWKRTALFPDAPVVVQITQRTHLYVHFPGRRNSMEVGAYCRENTCQWCKATPPKGGDT